MLRAVLLALVFLLASPASAQQQARAWPAAPLPGVTYTPRGVSFAGQPPYVSPGQIEADFALLSTVTRRVRTYSVTNGLDQALPIARKFGLRVSVGLWLGKDTQLNAREIAVGIAAVRANTDIVDRVFVGNETLLRKDLTEDQLRGYLREVRAAIQDRRIQVTTAEPWAEWLEHRDVAADCDVVSAILFPYWDKVGLNEAHAYTGERYDALQQAFPGRKIVIAETGWPSAGQLNGGAQPSLTGESMYIRAFAELAAARDFDYYIVEGFDQPWKVTQEGDVGAHWGLFDTTGRPKWRFKDRAPAPKGP